MANDYHLYQNKTWERGFDTIDEAADAYADAVVKHKTWGRNLSRLIARDNLTNTGISSYNGGAGKEVDIMDTAHAKALEAEKSGEAVK